jgi:hypothetical protein
LVLIFIIAICFFLIIFLLKFFIYQICYLCWRDMLSILCILVFMTADSLCEFDLISNVIENWDLGYTQYGVGETKLVKLSLGTDTIWSWWRVHKTRDKSLQVRIIHEDNSFVIEFYLGLFIGFDLIIIRYFI